MTEVKATNIVWHEGHVTRKQREDLLEQKGALIWLTGLPSSGKSTIAFTTEHALIERGRMAYVLDGDNIRHGLNKNLGFSAEDRAENIRRIGEVGKLFADAGIITLSSFVSPYRTDRDGVRELMENKDFIEVFINTPLDVCEERDPRACTKKRAQVKYPTSPASPTHINRPKIPNSSYTPLTAPHKKPHCKSSPYSKHGETYKHAHHRPHHAHCRPLPLAR